MKPPDAQTTPTVPAARLRWVDDQPVSIDYGDIYHATDGIAEVRRVFLVPNRFDARAASTTGFLRIGELGFGSGLNFVTAAERFLDVAPIGARLHFVSTEARPISESAFVRLALRRGRDQPLYRDLARHYPPRLSGWHRRDMAGGRVRLSLYLGNAADGLADLVGRTAPFDAWFLDGFAPDRNADMWSQTTLMPLAALSAPGTTLATFTAAGSVRRTLAQIGFHVRRVDQRPHKRHTVVAEFSGQTVGRPARPEHVAVAGAGLVGSCVAATLADDGIEVLLIDPAYAPGNGVAYAVLHPRLLIDASPRAQLRAGAYLEATRFFADYGFDTCGALQFESETSPLDRLHRIAAMYEHTGSWIGAVDARSASAIAGRPLRRSGLHFRDAMALSLPDVLRVLRSHPRIRRACAEVQGWSADARGASILTTTGRYEADALVLSTGPAARVAPETRFLEVLPVAGQIEQIQWQGMPTLPILGDGYLCPQGRAQCAVGATYEQRPWEVVRAREFNLQRAERFWHWLSATPTNWIHRGETRGVRAISSDRLPIVGAIPTPSGRLFANLAHGSSGTTTAPLAAAIIAESLGGEFAPLSRRQLALLAPDRFLARQTRRGLRHGAF